MTSERLTLGELTPLIEKEHLARYRFAQQFVKGQRVGDIACGTGYGTHMLAGAGAASVLGADLSQRAIDSCLLHYSAANITYQLGNAQNLAAIPDQAFDAVVSFETIEHLPDVEAYLSEMARILRPGGRFIVSTPDRRVASTMYPFTGKPANPHHVREFTGRELLSLLATRFEIDASYGQALISRSLVFWPVQFFVKSVCRIIGTEGARNYKDNFYSNHGNVDVVPMNGSAGIPKYWVISCIRPR